MGCVKQRNLLADQFENRARRHVLRSLRRCRQHQLARDAGRGNGPGTDSPRVEQMADGGRAQDRVADTVLDQGQGRSHRIQLQLDDATAQGVYTNLVMINHGENEFVLDFAYLQPSSPSAKVRARIISSPRHTKRLLAALQKNVERYEERFGTIELSDDPIVH